MPRFLPPPPRRGAPAAAALLAAGLLLAVAASGHQTPAGRASLSLDLHAQGEIVDLLAAVRLGEAVELRHQRSRDGGRSWSEPVAIDLAGRPPASPHRGADPQVVARGDTLLAAWTSAGSSPWGTGPLATARSDDGGRTWSAGPNPADDGSTDSHGYLDLAADGAGVFHAVWLDSRDGAQGLRAARSDDGGRSWRPNVTVDPRTCECCWNRLLAAGRGPLRVIYRDRDPRDLAVAVADDHGPSWRRLGRAGAFGWWFDGCPHVGGALAATDGDGGPLLHALAWTGADGREGLYTLASADGGVAWSEPRRLGGAGAHRSDLAARGRVLVAVWDEVTAAGRRVRAAFSADGGAAWSEPRDLSAPGVEASLPLVVAAGDGFLAAWTEGGKGEGATVVAARLAEPVADGRAGLRPAEPLPTGVEGASAGERGRR